MKISSIIKKPIYSALVFFGTLGILSAGYAGFVTLQTSDADSGKSLTSGMMQAVIGNLADLDSRVSSMSWAVTSLQGFWGTVTGGIGYSGGNVGIGTASPWYKLDVNGSIHGTKIYGNVYVGDSLIPSGQLLFARSELPYSYVSTLCPSPSRPIYVPQSQLGKTGSQLCALDGATDGAKTTCNSTKYIALKTNGSYIAYPTHNVSCATNLDFVWPWVNDGWPNSRPDEWIHGTRVVCCQ